MASSQFQKKSGRLKTDRAFIQAYQFDFRFLSIEVWTDKNVQTSDNDLAMNQFTKPSQSTGIRFDPWKRCRVDQAKLDYRDCVRLDGDN